MKELGRIVHRVWNSAVVWGWAFNVLRVGSYLILLPLVSRVLSEADFGFYWVLASIATFIPLLDLGIVTAIGRATSYAMGGARELRPQGMAEAEEKDQPHSPNFQLLWKLMFTTRSIYRILSLGVLLVMGAWGTYVTSIKVHETSDPARTWLAWGLTLACAVFETYAGWWNAYLRGLNQVLVSTRIVTFSYALKYVISALLLLGGGGLLSVPLAGLVITFIQRSLSRRQTMRFLMAHPFPPPSKEEQIAIFRTLWPNSWRAGVHCLCYYLTPHANTILCLQKLGLSATAQFGLSLQIMTILQGMAGVWLMVKWPRIGQLLTRQDFQPLREVLRSRLGLQLISFAMMAAVVIPLTTPLLGWLNTGKRILPEAWMILLAVQALLDMHYVTWTTFISVANRLPFLLSSILTNGLSIVLAFVLLHTTSLGIGALLLSPLLSGLLCNYWLWPREGARLLHTTWTSFLFSSKAASRPTAGASAH